MEKLTRDKFSLNIEYQNLVTKKLDVWKWFPILYHKWVRMALSRFHDKFVWTEMSNMITKEVIREVTGLCSTKPIPVLK